MYYEIFFLVKLLYVWIFTLKNNFIYHSQITKQYTNQQSILENIIPTTFSNNSNFFTIHISSYNFALFLIKKIKKKLLKKNKWRKKKNFFLKTREKKKKLKYSRK